MGKLENKIFKYVEILLLYIVNFPSSHLPFYRSTQYIDYKPMNISLKNIRSKP